MAIIGAMAKQAAERSGNSVEDERRKLTGYMPELSANGSVRGKAMFGMVRDVLREFCRDNKCAWSIQDGKLTLIPLGGYIPGEVPVLSARTGVIGIPEQVPSVGLKVQTLLNPTIKIGQAVKLETTAINQQRLGVGVGDQLENQTTAMSTRKRNYDGLYYVMCADHYGDTRGNEWYSMLNCLALDATVPMNLAPKASIAPEAVSIRTN